MINILGYLALGNIVKDKNDAELAKLLKANKIDEFIKKAVLYKKNIIISGGTSTGKTTFTNAALGEISKDERLITVEDAREINLYNHENIVSYDHEIRAANESDFTHTIESETFFGILPFLGMSWEF